MAEEWRPIRFFSMYEVSDLGRVRSLPRVVLRKHRSAGSVIQSRVGRILKPGYTEDGYPVVVLCDQGTRKTARVHLLVLEAFRGPRPGSFQGLHNDDDKKNCRLDNLRWGSAASNVADSIRNGRKWPKGQHHGCAKLTEGDAQKILTAPGGYRRIAELAKQFGVSRGTVHAIRSRQSWRHL